MFDIMSKRIESICLNWAISGDSYIYSSSSQLFSEVGLSGSWINTRRLSCCLAIVQILFTGITILQFFFSKSKFAYLIDN